MFPEYKYKARVISVYDGDTFRCDIDLGFNSWLHNEQIRLLNLDTPEVRGDEKVAGLVARDFVNERILNKHIVLQTEKDKKGKYGRWLATVWYCDVKTGEWIDLNTELVMEKLAEYKVY